MDDERSEESREPENNSGPPELSLLEAFDLLVASIPPENRHRRELYVMRSQIQSQQETIGEARQMIEKLEEVIKKVTSPANRIGTYLNNPARTRPTSWSAARSIIATSIRGSAWR